MFYIFDLLLYFFFPDLETIAMKMVDMYCKSLYLSRELDPQENMHGEELLSTVCNVLVHVSSLMGTSDEN